MHRPRPPAALLGLLVGLLSACAPRASAGDARFTERPQSGSEPQVASDATRPDPETTRTVRIVQRPGKGRAAEIVDTAGLVIETLAPEAFSQVLLVPDIEGNSSELIRQDVSGTDIVAASIEPGTGRILLAVRGFIYAEVSTDLVLLLPPTGSEARSSASVQAVYFDGPGPERDAIGHRPHLDVSGVSFQDGGHLQIDTADASGGACRLVYDRAGVPLSCTWSAGESRRCPDAQTKASP